MLNYTRFFNVIVLSVILFGCNDMRAAAFDENEIQITSSSGALAEPSYVQEYRNYLSDENLDHCCMIMTSPVVDPALTTQFIAGYPDNLQKELRSHTLPVPRRTLTHWYLLTGDAHVGKSRFGAILADIHKCPLLRIKVPSLERALMQREFNLLLDPLIESNQPWIILCSRMDSGCEDAAEAGRKASRALELIYDKLDISGGQENSNLIIVATATSHTNITDGLKRKMITGCFTIQPQDRASLHAESSLQDATLSSIPKSFPIDGHAIKEFLRGCAGGTIVGALVVGAYFGFRTYKPYFEWLLRKE